MEQETKQPHELEDKPKQKNGKGMVAALVIVIILAIAAIGGTWYYMNNQAKNDKKARDAQIQELQKQVDELKKQAEADKAALEKSRWATYNLTTINSTFQYPVDWNVSKPALSAGYLEYVNVSSPTENDGFNVYFEVTKQGSGLENAQNSSKTTMTSIDSFNYNNQNVYLLTYIINNDTVKNNYFIPVLSSNNSLIRSVLAPNGNIVMATIAAKGGTQQPPAFSPDAPVFQVAKNIIKSLKVK